MTASTLDADLAAAAVSWGPALLVPRGIVAMPIDAPTADALHWGDGKTTPVTGNPLRHTYDKAAAYNVSAMQGEVVLATASVVVRDGLAPDVEFAPTDPDNPNIIEATFNDDGPISHYEITWGGVTENVVAPKGTVRRKGFAAGTHPIVVRDLLSGRTLSTEITVVDKEYSPDFTIAQGANTMTALLELTQPAEGGREITVDWADGAQTVVAAADAKAGYRATHPYAANGEYWVQVKFSNDPESGRDVRVVIPFAARSGKGIGRP